MNSYVKLDIKGNALPDIATSWSMVKDNVTGLIWEMKIDDWFIHDMYDRYTWQDAQDLFIKELNKSKFGGFSDWRMPTIKELFSISDTEKFNQTIDTNYFFNTISSSYWSSTTDAISNDFAWLVDFLNGYVYVNNKSSYSYVRAVRNELNYFEPTETNHPQNSSDCEKADLKKS